MKIFFSAIEGSGDRLAAGLVKQLKISNPSVQIVGFGSFNMQRSGMKLLGDYSYLSAIGLVESISKLFVGLKALRIMKKSLVAENPTVLVLVDAPGFNLPLATFAKKRGIKVVYFIPPQNYLWDGKKRGRVVVERTDAILAIYRRGFEFYKSLGADCSFVGHPLVSLYKDYLSEKTLAKHESEPSALKKNVIGMIPGTRRQELKKLLPLFIGVAEKMHLQNNQLIFLWAGYGEYQKKILKSSLARVNFNYQILEEESFCLADKCEVVLVKSGTASLEVALTKTLQLIVYKISSVSYFIFKYLWRVGRKLKFIGLPNLIAGTKIVEELVQKKVTVGNLEKGLRGLLNANVPANFDIGSLLGSENVYELAAENIIKLAKRKN